MVDTYLARSHPSHNMPRLTKATMGALYSIYTNTYQHNRGVRRPGFTATHSRAFWGHLRQLLRIYLSASPTASCTKRHRREMACLLPTNTDGVAGPKGKGKGCVAQSIKQISRPFKSESENAILTALFGSSLAFRDGKGVAMLP